MKCLVCVAAICGCLYGGNAAAQSGGCPSGFTMNPAGSGEELADRNLDGQICRSQADVGSTGIVEVMLLDNSAPLCGCPDAFLPEGPHAAHPADRNDDRFVCRKVVVVGPPDPPVTLKTIYIDNRKCNP